MATWIDELSGDLAVMDGLRPGDVTTALLSAADCLVEGAKASEEEFDSAMMHFIGESPSLFSAINRAISFQQNDDGSRTGLWLVPLSLDCAVAMPSVFELDPKLSASIESRLADCLSLKMDLTVPGATMKGWVRALPLVIGQSSLADITSQELIRLSGQMRDHIRGIEFPPSVTLEASVIAPETSEVFYLPLVVHFAAGVEIGEAKLLEPAAQSLTQWVQSGVPEALREALFIEIHGGPMPYAQALELGDHALRHARVSEFVLKVREVRGVAPGGMVAFVSVYEPQGGGVTEEVVGLTLSSILSGAVLATTTFDINEDPELFRDGVAESLKALGLHTVIVPSSAKPTSCCQHCGKLQLAAALVTPVTSGTLQ